MTHPEPGVFELGGNLYYAEYAPENVTLMRGDYTVDGPDKWLVWECGSEDYFAMTHDRFTYFFVPVDVNAYAQYNLAGMVISEEKAEVVDEIEYDSSGVYV